MQTCEQDTWGHYGIKVHTCHGTRVKARGQLCPVRRFQDGGPAASPAVHPQPLSSRLRCSFLSYALVSLHLVCKLWTRILFKERSACIKREALGGLRPGSLSCCYLASGKEPTWIYCDFWVPGLIRQGNKNQNAQKTQVQMLCVCVLSHWQSSPTLGAGRMGQWSGVQTALHRTWAEFNPQIPVSEPSLVPTQLQLSSRGSDGSNLRGSLGSHEHSCSIPLHNAHD